ncbi:hypothetical protein H5410_053663 [Solanum commersonii]|uniref:Uncharacterized protein n=1 Tax=Solanum commersonii TaxID=4109 RepID=A0A9J5X6Z5_SOLCO|nr:hypothetical protein H5410_053663 [Solanum commersonii]
MDYKNNSDFSLATSELSNPLSSSLFHRPKGYINTVPQQKRRFHASEFSHLLQIHSSVLSP